MDTIALIGALDTKGADYAFVCDAIRERGFETLLIDIGILGTPCLEPDVTRHRVAAAGGVLVEELQAADVRGAATTAMGRGLRSLLPELYSEGRFDGVFAMGGSGGTSVACGAMRELPFGVPKVMVSTVAGGDVAPYVGVSDIVMIPSVVDVCGINSISRLVYARAAAAICAMTETTVPAGVDKPVILASMFGNTTKAVEAARVILEKAGYEVLIFHATGTGGRTMESLIGPRRVAGVLDITTTEWADELVGGILSAGPERLQAAAQRCVPAVVAPGCLDMVNFGAPETIPLEFKDRRFYKHNDNITLMRTDVEENRQLGKILAEKLSLSSAPVTVVLPLQGLSVIDSPGGEFWWPEANQALFDALKSNLRQDIPVVELDCNINDAEFAERTASALLENIAKGGAAWPSLGPKS